MAHLAHLVNLDRRASLGVRVLSGRKVTWVLKDNKDLREKAE